MKQIEQTITGDNNVQIGVNNVIHTQKVNNVIAVRHDASKHITNEQAFKIKDKVTEIANMVATNGTTTAKAFSTEWTAFKNKFKFYKSPMELRAFWVTLSVVLNDRLIIFCYNSLNYDSSSDS